MANDASNVSSLELDFRDNCSIDYVKVKSVTDIGATMSVCQNSNVDDASCIHDGNASDSDGASDGASDGNASDNASDDDGASDDSSYDASDDASNVIICTICSNCNEWLDNSIVVYEKIIIPDQPKEREDDNREYKLFLEFSGCKRKFESRSTQLLNRLIVGEGKALYLIGLYDDGRIEGISLIKLSNSINNICKMANNIGGSIRRVAIYNTKQNGNYIAAIRLELPNFAITDDMFIM